MWKCMHTRPAATSLKNQEKKRFSTQNYEALLDFAEKLSRAEYIEQETSRGERMYVPLSVWQRKGFDVKMIEQNDDKQWHAEMVCFVYGFTVRARR